MLSSGFPWPLLNADSTDYPNGDFTISAEVTADGSDVAMNVAYALSSPGLLGMVQRGKLVVKIQVSSSAVGFRRTAQFASDSCDLTFSFSSLDVSQSVKVVAKIIALEPLESFYLEEHNSLFFDKETAVDIPAGSILAESNAIVFPVNREELPQEIPSIITIDEDPSVEGLFVDFSGHQIHVHVPSAVKNGYFSAVKQTDKTSVATGLLPLPVLVEAIATLKNEEAGIEAPDHIDLDWYKVLLASMQEKGISLESNALQIADKLLEGNVQRALVQLGSLEKGASL